MAVKHRISLFSYGSAILLESSGPQYPLFPTEMVERKGDFDNAISSARHGRQHPCLVRHWKPVRPTLLRGLENCMALVTHYALVRQESIMTLCTSSLAGCHQHPRAVEGNVGQMCRLTGSQILAWSRRGKGDRLIRRRHPVLWAVGVLGWNSQPGIALCPS